MEKQSQKSLDLLATNITVVKSVVAAVKGTIGPKGLDVMLVDEFNQPNCTNDGVEILSNLKISHPISKLVIDGLKSQELQVGDGTTSTAILIESLLDSAYQKIQNGNRVQKITKGIELALAELIKLIQNNSNVIQSVNDPNLKNIIRISARENQEITDLIVQASKKLSNSGNYDLSESIVGTSFSPSQVLDGIFIKKKTHYSYKSQLENIQALIIEGPLEPEPMSSEAISTNEGVKKLDHNIETIIAVAETIIKAGIQAVFTNASMFPAVEELFAREGVFVLTHIKKSDLNNLREVSGAELLTRAKLKHLKADQIKIASGKFLEINLLEDLAGYCFLGAKAQEASIVINAETETLIQEKIRICTDAVKAMQASLRSGYLVGEGIAELNLIEQINNFKKQFANDPELAAGFDVVTDAMKSIFSQILENAGLDPKQAMQKIQFNPQNFMGIDLDNGSPIDLNQQGVLDPTEVKISAFKIASSIAIQILRINLIVQSK